ncbi:strawberry notch C-terminal domain-containing protein [Cereibacter sphaeroides]|uniref:strawberry notch C-terminal domain-containing protein n=1 Tax=Cereibacter sphaeroides TaxID=1063 RepID=UPI001F1E89D8|nr:strawberry notch C-terminal domain-containing protein [Cereibacter sphaeroides]MCE6959251.1 strawberry notch C-terminal domain-containing protein [Cereibacter sphaeroides]MCE6972054.1 strawberry notch C-terminal domain-containing protein [Cereibacter sphaeroides]
MAAETPETTLKKPDPRDYVAWIRFDREEAVLKRVVLPGSARALLLQVRDPADVARINEAARGMGFVELRSPDRLRMILKDGKVPFGMRDAAKALGATAFALSRSDLEGRDWTIDLSQPAPAPAAPTAVEPPEPEKRKIIPDPDTIATIGLNHRGEEVVRDGNGRFFRKINQEDGRSDFIHEGDGGQPTLFLRATRREDLETIAASLVLMAARGTLHKADFDRVLEAALEEGPHGRLDLDPAVAAEDLRRGMLRRIAETAVENDASRERFIAALRLANASGFVLSRSNAAGQAFEPSPAMIAFLRRATRGQDVVDVRGSDDLQIALPRGRREDASLQVHDLGQVPADLLNAYVLNVLQRRPVDGRSIFLMPGEAGAELVESLRGEIGRNYALEAVAEATSAVADGIQDSPSCMMFFVGERRPEPLDALPQAVLRTFRVVTTDDLMNLEREVNRSRNRIRDFHEGVEAEAGAAEDGRAENQRQKPYQPLSRAGEPFTMIPVALEGATTRAMERVRRDLEGRGGIDAAVASALGLDIGSLGATLTPEQVDALGMWMVARERGRGFLLADQTGVGKGRSLASIARAHLRADPRNKVLYFTESAQINVPDVCRDLKDVGAWNEIDPLFLTTGSSVADEILDPVTGIARPTELKSPPPRERNRIFASEAWPDDKNIILTTYSQFNSKEDDIRSIWISRAVDEHTLIIMDEAHNALNKASNTGRNLRAAIAVVGTQNVVFGTATPARNPSGMDLYAPLLPQTEDGRLKEILDNIQSGGEVAQEAFTSMLAQDGVLLRRDHDLSNIEFRVALPDDERMLRYQAVMDRFSPVVELMLEASTQIGEHMGRRQALEYRAAVNRGIAPERARAMTNEMNQYSLAIGGPLANLARIAMNAIKIDQVVDEALAEMREGRKPLITFHSTNQALLNELARGADGRASEEAMRNVGPLTLRDQIRRIHASLYKVRIGGETEDARVLHADVARTFELIEQAIDTLPDDLPVSPIDALIDRFEAQGVSVGEISGRTLCYRNGEIQRRGGRNRKETIDSFNSGALDILIYNSAGATGGSYHASPKFADQRPRTMIELETPVDIIKYVQSQGRGNRYGQVANPRVKSVMTGLTPEMRILQQRNKKLRSLGASVDGNRAHPLLLDDVPDLLNKVGDEATRNVLLSMPSLARRLGFPEFAEDPENQRQRAGNEAVDTGSGVAATGIESLSNKVLARSIMLPAREQDDLVQRISLEFDALIEELESRNANPLRPKMLAGQVEVRATSLFSGQVTGDDDLDASAFLAPLYVSTAIHHFNEEAWNGEKLVAALENCRRVYGTDGFRPWAERIMQNLPAILRAYLPEGTTIEQALEDPGAVSPRFAIRHTRTTDLAWLLENMQPGVAIRFPSETDMDGLTPRIIVGLVPPKDARLYDLPSAYKIQTISPGMAHPETTSVSRLIGLPLERIIFRPGLSDGYDASFLEEFSNEALLTRRTPVQILSGNVLQAITEAARHDLGTVSLYRDMENHVHRGIVVAKHKIDLEKLPVPLPSPRVAAEVFWQFLESGRFADINLFKIWGGLDPEKGPGERSDADVMLTVTHRSFRADIAPLRRSTYAFYRDRPGLYELLHREPLPAFKDVPIRADRRGEKHKYLVDIRFEGEGAAAEKQRAMEIIGHLHDIPLMTDGTVRALVNETTITVERLLNGLTPAAVEAGADVDEAPGEVEEGAMEAEVEAEADMDYDDINWG